MNNDIIQRYIEAIIRNAKMKDEDTERTIIRESDVFNALTALRNEHDEFMRYLYNLDRITPPCIEVAVANLILADIRVNLIREYQLTDADWFTIYARSREAIFSARFDHEVMNLSNATSVAF